jgi:phosphopantetheinyl transferase
MVFLCQAKSIIRLLEKNHDCNVEITVPVEAQYELRAAGKPYWQQKFLEQFPTKKFPYFSISHSGAYAALVISDCDIGLDIQQERETTYVGGCREFSRMEAFVKCTGDGYAKGFNKYKKLEKKTAGFVFSKVDVLNDYVIYLCYKIVEDIKRC